MTKYVIIGSGAAGVAAAGSIRKKDQDGHIQIFSNDPYGYYSRPGLAYLLAGEVPKSQLFPFNKDYFKKLKIQIISRKVKAIHPELYEIIVDQNVCVPYDKLLISTGASASMPKVPGVDLEGVVKLDNMDDADQILKNVRKNRTAVVIGGGITALELVEGFAANGIRVHYFLRGDRYWSSVLDEVESRIVENILKHDGIQIHYHTDLVDIEGRKGKVKGVNAVENQAPIHIDCNIVAFAIGIRPRTRLAVEAGLDTDRGILVDEYMQTSHKDVFAAGDVAQVYDQQSGEHILDSLWRPAIEQGWVAGLNMTGEHAIYEKKFSFNVTRLGGLVTTIIGKVGKEKSKTPVGSGDADVNGIMRGDSETWRSEAVGVVAQTYQETNRIRLYLTPTAITGAIVMGDQTLSRPLQEIIREKVDIHSIHDQIISQPNTIKDILTQFWKEYTAVHA